MVESLPERRMAENEVVFRDANMRIQDGIDKIKQIAVEDGAAPIHFDPQMPLMFICECADEKCTKRIKIALDEYNDIHRSPKQFVVARHHDVPRIEKVIAVEPNYLVVEKHEKPPKHVPRLRSTDLDMQKD